MLTAKMNRENNDLNSEHGLIMIITMLVLVVLTVLCIGALDSSNFEVQIAANDRQSRVAFNLADGAVFASSKLISETIETGVAPDTPAYQANGLSYVNLISNFTTLSTTGCVVPNEPDMYLNRVLGFSPPRLDDLYDFMIDTNGIEVCSRINTRKAEGMAGGSAEFATGSAGAGAGSAAGVSVVYDLDIDSYTERNSNARLAVRYRKVIGVTGGI